MYLTPEEIATIAESQPIRVGFGIHDTQTATRIQGIVDRINSSGDLGCKILDDDNLSNYFALFVYLAAELPSFARQHRVEGLLIYLSACAPVGVVGRTEKIGGPSFSAYDPLEIDKVLNPDHPNGRLEEVAFEAIRSGGYELLSVEEVSKPLPSGVKPEEYCFGPEPWDRVYHVLFANTD